ncbi:hypothetical protein Calkro_0193 [Caldicellulosiruptor kronotskyensis 2002]|uniref:Uncharacterized protein n=2 Tax=Caldicellulosiruptor TaxID=44000 RepID=E4SD42_CALK2|nr:MULTISPECIES: hypothetical protein [Caldicellulosiruptor]ADQ41826.1 hypothetical protein Calkr_2384 [Caldicellulosiruptor acetigenus I77R1B]ADQ45106.1 hypothetical protein Calkro_0193 [Caldicellulosiruptor kronotskyensis 2002]
MKRSVYIFAFLAIVYEIFVGTLLTLKRENISLSEYWGWGLSVIAMVAILGLLNGIFGGEKLSNILAINIFAVIIINLISAMFTPLILTEDVKQKLLKEATQKNIELSLGNNMGNIISGIMLYSVIVALMTFAGFKISAILRKKLKRN